MSQEVNDYIEKIAQPWQVEVCRALDQTIRQAIPDVTDRLQYGKPHYLKNGKYACVLGTAKGWVSFTIFNTAAIDAPDNLFEPGPPERKTIKVKPGQELDYSQISSLIQQAASTI